MKPGEASSTARFNALFRAIESSRRPKRNRLIEDPFASEFLGNLKFYYLIRRVPLLGRLLPLYIDWKWPGVRPSHVSRTRWIDDRVLDALNGGIEQVVILGAGYDCRAFRLPGIEKSRVFELDHPETHRVKLAGLARVFDTLPGHVRFVEADLDRKDIASTLETTDFDSSMPTFFLAEGLLHYLSEDAVDRLLRSLGAISAPRSLLVFTYVHRGLLDGTARFEEMGSVPATLRESGETWRFGLYPEEVSSYLAERGFGLVTDVGSSEYRKRYMGPDGPHMKGFKFYRVALARVSSAPPA